MKILFTLIMLFALSACSEKQNTSGLVTNDEYSKAEAAAKLQRAEVLEIMKAAKQKHVENSKN